MEQTAARRRARGNGEGSIYLRVSDGKWCGALTVAGGQAAGDLWQDQG